MKSRRRINTSEVIILGAGAAGLAAARLLAPRRSVLLLEARPRVGGRILTHHESSLPIPLELGAEFVHGNPPSTWDFIRQAPLTPYTIPFEHIQRRGKTWIQLPHYIQQLDKPLAGLAHLGKHDLSFAQYLKNQKLRDPRARRLALDFVEGFDAADPNRISAKSLAEEREGLGDLDSESQYRLLEGYGGLIAHLQKSLHPHRVHLRLNTIATEIHWSKHRVAVHTPREIFHARRLLITLPLGVLQVPPESPGSVRFIPDIAPKRHALNLLASGPVIKVLFRFSPGFWHSLPQKIQNTSFLHRPGNAIPTWWTAAPRLPLLTGWVGGPKSLPLSNLPPRISKTAALTALSKLLGISPQRLAPNIASFHTHDWPADPFARGAYSYVTVGGGQARKALSQPLAQTLFFAGEATDTSGQASTVAGALSSARRAATQLLNSL